MRAVLDPNVLISALLSPRGTPAQAVRRWLDGAFDLIVSELLLAELERALAYPKLRTRITAGEAAEFLALLRRAAEPIQDPDLGPPVRSPDPGDDYLIALAEAARAVIVSGDGHLLGLVEQLPVYAPTAFLELLDTDGP